MLTRQVEDVSRIEVTTEGARGVTMRVAIGANEGAPHVTMRLFEIAAGGHTPRHAHPHEHEIIVKSGSGILWAAKGELPLTVDTVALVSPHEEHQFIAGSDGMTMWCIVPNEGHQY